MDELFGSEDMPIHRKSVLPGAGFFVPDSIREERFEREVEAALEGASVAVVADADADGLACVAILREVYEDVRGEPVIGARDDEDERPDHAVALVPASPHEIDEALARVAAEAPAGIDVVVCDLAPDAVEDVAEPLDALTERADSVGWYDHHQWDPAVAAAVRERGVTLEVGDSETECSADVVVRSVPGADVPRLEELAAVTRDHDLWIRDDPRSQDLADFAYWTDPETYVETVRRSGPDLSSEVEEYLEERRVEKKALIEQALSRSEYREIGGYTVGVTYGRCSQNEVAEHMRQAGADCSIVVKPAGSASIRGTDAFDRCHEVAGLVGGGGHPKAAGCKPPVHEDMLDFAHHWVTRGAVTRQVILEAFETVVAADP